MVKRGGRNAERPIGLHIYTGKRESVLVNLQNTLHSLNKARLYICAERELYTLRFQFVNVFSAFKWMAQLIFRRGWGIGL